MFESLNVLQSNNLHFDSFLYISSTPAFLPTITSFQIQLRICDLVDGLSFTVNLDMYLFQLDSNS